MNIATIPVRNLRRKPLRSLLMVLVFAIGIASVVALNYLAGAVGASLEEKLTAFGANILVAPQKESLHVSYGGMALGDVAFEVKSLEEATGLCGSPSHVLATLSGAPRLADMAVTRRPSWETVYREGT